MLIYRFLDRNAAICSIKDRALRISRLSNLNDPFEFLCVDLSDKAFRSGMLRFKDRMDKTHGLICFSRNWSSPLLWGHYAEKHQGLCLAFQASPKNSLFHRVEYVEQRLPKPDILSEDFTRKLLYTKFKQWAYEEEVRAYANLNEERDGHYYYDFSDMLKLKKVIIGSESDLKVSDIAHALGDLKSEVEILSARPAFREFKVVKNQRK